jgi:hypothetical protein
MHLICLVILIINIYGLAPFAIFNFIWRQNTALDDFFGDNILFIKNYFVLLSINGEGKKHRVLERAS